MRNAFIKAITEIGKDENVILLINDTGQFILQEFANRYPGRLLNVGIAEQNMVGLAAGLAASGKTVFVYSIASFFARCYEQIKVDICYHNLNVKFVGVGAGLAYGTMGITHHATEDIAIFRALPNMRIVSPCDSIETGQAVEAIYPLPGPVYLRLGLTGEEKLHSDYIYRFGDIDYLRKGNDIAILVTGRLASNAMLAAGTLEKNNVSATVVNIHTIKPFNIAAVVDVIDKFAAILTVEEHNIIGGMGSAVAEVIAAHASKPVRFKRLGILDRYCCEYGSRSYLEDRLGLSDLCIANEAMFLLGRDT